MHQDGFTPPTTSSCAPPPRSARSTPTSRQLQLATGERIGYRRLPLATGAASRRLPLPAMDLDGVHYLRTRQDADTLATAYAHAEHVVAVGTGWIGSEAAASLRQLGREVTWIGPDTALLAWVLGPEIGRVYRDLHADHGVRLALAPGSPWPARPRPGRGRPHQQWPHLRLRPGAGRRRRRPADRAGRGGRPPVRDGVLVNEQLEAVGAAGAPPATSPPPGTPATRPTCASSTGRMRSTRVPRRPATCSASSPRTRGFHYSDQYDLGMEYSGFAADWDRVVVRGDLAAREFIAFWLKDQRVVAAMNAGVWDVVEPIQQLSIRGGRPVDLARLANPDFPDQVTSGSLTSRRWQGRPRSGARTGRGRSGGCC